jgi:hypothetical protein
VDNDLAAELSQDADTKDSFGDERKIRPFNLVPCRRMEQLSLSLHDVAVSLGSTLDYVSDLRSGVKTPTEQRIVEFSAVVGSNSGEPQDSGKSAGEWHGGRGLVHESSSRHPRQETQVC